jgi:hypothetical protein
LGFPGSGSAVYFPLLGGMLGLIAGMDIGFRRYDREKVPETRFKEVLIHHTRHQ